MRLMNLFAVFMTASVALAQPQALTVLCAAICGLVVEVNNYLDAAPKYPLRSV